MHKIKNIPFCFFLVSLFINPVFAQSATETPPDTAKVEIIKIATEFCKKHKEETYILQLLSKEYVNRITTEQYNNIIKMFSISRDAITEESSPEERQYILAYWIKEKYFPSDNHLLIFYESPYSIKKIDDTTYETALRHSITVDLVDLFDSPSAPENHIIVTWLKEDDKWKIKDLKYDKDSPLIRYDRRYDINNTQKVNILIDTKSNRTFDANITFPIVEGNLHNEKLKDFYPGGLLRWNIGKDIDHIVKLYGGLSWQLTDTSNYFFIDIGTGLKFNVLFGNLFAVTPEVSVIGKMNIVLNQLVFGFDTEGGSTFHFHSNNGREIFYLRTFYQHTFLFKHDYNSDDKGLYDFNFGKIGFGVGVPIY